MESDRAISSLSLLLMANKNVENYSVLSGKQLHVCSMLVGKNIQMLAG
jgi:hypothetical protein